MSDSEICRICLRAPDLQDNQKLREIDEDTENIFRKLFGSILNEINEIPNYMCEKCYQKLMDSNEFFEEVLKCIKLLKEEKSDSVNHEIKDEKSIENQIEESEDNDSDFETNETQEEKPKNQIKILNRRRRRKMIKSVVASEDNEIQNFFNLSCDSCDDGLIPFSSFRLYSDHMKLKHDTKIPFIMCCKKKLFKRSELLGHLDYHKTPEKYQCPLCKHQCFDVYQLKKHTNKCQGPERPEEFQCQDCSMKFTTINTLASHRFVHLTREEKDQRRVHACDQCSSRFTSVYRLNRHYKERHEGISLFLCHGCAKTFYSKSDFIVHYKSIHATKSKVKCEICGSMLKHERALRRHLRNMHESKGPWICKQCNKETPTLEALKSHERYNHSNAVTSTKQHECDICEKTFKKLGPLREHLQTHFGDNQIKFYVCEFCHKTFNSSSNKTKHKKRMHPNEYLPR